MFVWAILGRYSPDKPKSSQTPSISINSVTVTQSKDANLARFWETEEIHSLKPSLTPEKRAVQQYFDSTHLFLPSVGQYSIMLPKRTHAPLLGESSRGALQRYEANEKAILRKGTWEQFQSMVQEYLNLRHAELVPTSQISKPCEQTYYLPMLEH